MSQFGMKKDIAFFQKARDNSQTTLKNTCKKGRATATASTTSTILTASKPAGSA
jgi:hypothetical protein